MLAKGILVLAVITCFISVSTAQCTGLLTNSTLNVSLSWSVLTGNTVRFTFSAPSKMKQFIILIFTDSNQTMTLSPELTGDLVYATYRRKIVHDKWLEDFTVKNDSQQDLIDFELNHMNDQILVISFTRLILSEDKLQDIDIDTRRYVGWGFGGYAPFRIKTTRYHTPKYFGFFDTPMCLKRCEKVKAYNPPTSSAPAIAHGSAIVTLATILTVVASATAIAV